MDKKILSYVIRITFGAAVIFFVWWLLSCQCIHLGPFTPASLRDYIRGFGKLAAVVYVAAYALNTISLVPPIGVLSLSAGLAFGKGWGAVLLMIGALLGTSATFFISRLFGRAFIERILRGKFSEFDTLLEKKGFVTVLFFRVVPLIPYEVINYASGLSRIRFKDYFSATFLGLIPGVAIAAFFGGELGKVSELKDLMSFGFIGALAALISIILIPVLYRHFRKKGKYGK